MSKLEIEDKVREMYEKDTFCCPICGKKVSSIGALDPHIHKGSTSHESTRFYFKGNGLYSCPKCEKKKKGWYKFRRHFLDQHGVQPMRYFYNHYEEITGKERYTDEGGSQSD